MSRRPASYASELEGDRGSHRRWSLRRFRLSFRSSVLFLILLVVFITASVTLVLRGTRNRGFQWKKWEGSIYSFDAEPRPGWMDLPAVQRPLSLHVAVLSSPTETKRRQLIRDYIFKGVRRNEVSIEYRFMVASRKRSESTARQLRREHEEHGDLIILPFEDSFDRLSEKRYAALKWSESFSNGSYDYFMNMDSDTFVRFGALARRLPTVLEDRIINPREQPVIIARMNGHFWHWLTTVSDENMDTIDEDLRLDGPWYSYPVGIGYMLSSFLVKQLVSTQPPLPHHVHFPNDDVLIGSWLSSLKTFSDPDHKFHVSPKNPWNTATRIQPYPLLPDRVDTIVINDRGWHDYPGRANIDEIGGAIGWNSVCIHHVKEKEIKVLRGLDGFRGEWD